MAMLDELEGEDRWEQVFGEMVPLDLVAQVHSDTYGMAWGNNCTALEPVRSVILTGSK